MKKEFRSIISFILVMVMMLSVVFSVPVTASAQETEAEVSDSVPEIECTDADAVVRYVQPEIEKEPESAKRDKDIAGTSANIDVAQTSYISGVWEYYLDSEYYDPIAEEYITTATISGYTGSSTTVTFPEKIDGYDVMSIDFYDFTSDECNKLVNVTLPATVTYIYGWNRLSKLKSISVSKNNPNFVIKSGVLYSKDMAVLFYYPIYKKDTTFNVPSTITRVNIEDNKYLKKLVLSDAVYSLNLYDCTALTSIAIGKGMEYFYYYNLPKLTTFTVNSANEYFSVKDGILYDKKYTRVECYPGGKTSTTYTAPSTVKGISISNNKYLKKVKVSAKTQDVSLSGCKALTSLTLGNSVKYVGCYNLPVLASLKLPDSVTGVSLRNCNALTSLALTKKVEWASISNCPKMKAVSVSSANKYYSAKDGVLYNKKKTELAYYPSAKTSTSFAVPSTVKYITVSDNKYLKKLTLSSAAERVNISYLPKVSALALPKKVQYLTVYSLTGLKSVTASSANKYFYAKGNVLFSKDKKTLKLYPAAKTGSSYTVPTSVTTISDRAFADNKYLKTVTMNKNVVTINYGAFANCSNLSTAAMSKKLKTIGEMAFIDCPKLKTLSIPKCITDIYSYAMGYVSTKTPHQPKKTSIPTARGYKGTETQTYAKENGLKFTNITPSKVKVSVSKVTLGVGETYNLDEVITPSNKVDVVKWSTSDKSVVIVNSTGVIAAKKAGTATIKVTTSNNKTATCKVTVKKAPTKLSLNKKSATLKVKKQVNLNPKFYSGQYANKVTFKSSNTKIATVNATGVVTAKKKGTVTITAKTYNGKKCTCKITVK